MNLIHSTGSEITFLKVTTSPRGQWAKHFELLPVFTNPFVISIRFPPALWINPSDVGDEIFQLWGSIPWLLMHWRLKCAEHQRARCSQCRTNMYCCSRINSIHLGQAKSKIRFQNVHMTFMIFKTIQYVKSLFCQNNKTTNYVHIHGLNSFYAPRLELLWWCVTWHVSNCEFCLRISQIYLK